MTYDQIKKWERVREMILSLEHLEADWDGAGAPPVLGRIVRDAIRWCERLESHGSEAPITVYPLSDGNVILEWHLPDDVIKRIEIKPEGVAEEMITAPSAKASFRTLPWHTIHRPGWAIGALGPYTDDFEDECYSLAA